MKKNILFLISGLVVGGLIMSFVDKAESGNETKYIELKEDFILTNGSVLKKGALLRIDQSYSEGHTRYILYINYKGEAGMELKKYDKENLINPYWMYRTDSTIVH